MPSVHIDLDESTSVDFFEDSVILGHGDQEYDLIYTSVNRDFIECRGRNVQINITSSQLAINIYHQSPDMYEETEILYLAEVRKDLDPVVEPHRPRIKVSLVGPTMHVQAFGRTFSLDVEEVRPGDMFRVVGRGSATKNLTVNKYNWGVTIFGAIEEMEETRDGPVIRRRSKIYRFNHIVDEFSTDSHWEFLLNNGRKDRSV